jgi:hypothetical protein
MSVVAIGPPVAIVADAANPLTGVVNFQARRVPAVAV